MGIFNKNMRLLITLLHSLALVKANDEVLAQNTVEHDEQAADICDRFYADRLGEKGTSSVSVLNRGTICVIYKCKTTKKHDPNEVVVRIDTNPAFRVNETEIALINMQLSEQGARNKVYKWTEKEKIEELLVDMDDSPDLLDENVQIAVAKELAKMHSSNIEGLDKGRYREATDAGFWNTYHIKYHFEQIQRFMAAGVFPGTMDLVLSGMGMSLEEVNYEINFVERLVHRYLERKPETPVVSHNDCRERNIMFNKNADIIESVLFVDFDLTAYGFRTWDILYQMTKWPATPTETQIDRFVVTYTENLTRNKINADELKEMLDFFRPYVLLEQWFFVHAYAHPQNDVNFREQYEEAIQKFNRRLTRPKTEL